VKDEEKGMRVTVRDAAALLKTSEKQIYDWIESGNLPAYKISNQYRINRSELLEWATARKIAIAPVLFQEAENEEQIPTISESLRRGGVFHSIHGNNRDEVLHKVIHVLRLSDESEREMLVEMLLARESLGSTGIGDGIAIPHVRNPIVLATDEPLLSLCFLEPPIDFNAIDAQPIYALFVLFAPTIHIHLQMLARLAYLLRIPEFRACIRAMPKEEEVIATAARLEKQS
jgi:PTS system nitrogen regulatory IIA component